MSSLDRASKKKENKHNKNNSSGYQSLLQR